MRLRLPIACLLVASALLVVAPSALAQAKADAPKADAPAADGSKPAAKPPPPTPAEIAQRAQDLCDRGDTQEAITALSSAFTQKPDPIVAAALARCEVTAKRWAAAADHLSSALHGMTQGPVRKDLEDRLAEVRNHVGTLTITVNVEGADVFVGDRFVGLSPLAEEVFADPGKNLVTVKKPNFDEANQTVEVAARGSAAVKIDLVVGGQSPNPYARSTRSRLPFYVVGGAGLVAAGVGGALWSAALAKGGAADQLVALGTCKPVCATVYSLRQGHDTFANAGTGALVGGGVAIVAATLYGVWAFNGSAPSSTGAVTLAPVATPSGGGLWMSGRF